MIIKAKNFMSWEKLEFSVVNGVTLISGFNHDDGTPEGSGKSAILNALCWGFFGEMPKDANIDEVIREGSKSCEVEIIMPEMTVFRRRGPNDLHIRYGERIYRGKDAHETQKTVIKELGMSFDTFCQAVYFAQNYQKKFVTANQKDKGKILSELLDLEQFERARERAAKRAKIAKESHAAAVKDVQRYEALHGESLKSISSYEELIEQFQTDKVTKIQKMVEEYQGLETEAEKYVEQFEADKAAKLSRFKKELKTLLNEVETRQAAHDELAGALAEFNRTAIEESYNRLEEQESDLENERNDLKVKLGSIDALIKAQEKREKDLKKFRNEMPPLMTNIHTLNSETKDREKDVEMSRIELQKAEAAMKNPSGECPTCGQDWKGDATHFSAELAKAEKSYKRSQDVLASHQRSIKQSMEQADALKEKIDALEKEISEFEMPTTTKLEQKIEKASLELDKVRSEMKALEKEVQEFEKAEIQLKALAKEVKQAQDLLGLKQDEQERVENESPVKQLEAYQKRMDTLQTQVEAEDAKEPTLLVQKLESAQESAEKNKRDLTKADEVKTERETELLRLEALRDGYKEVKSYTFQSVLSQLTRKANSYLSDLFGQDVKIQFKNVDMEIDVQVTIDGKQRSLGMYSGGQARRIHLAVDLALSDITMSRKGNKLNMMILDEYCKDLSEVSMEKVLHLLQARKGATILIEHNSIFKSIVNNTFEVELVGGISRRVE